MGTFVPSGSTQAKEIWDEQLWRDSQKQTFFSKFSSELGNSIVYEKKELTKSQGELIRFGLRARMASGYLPSGTDVRGNEGKLSVYMDAVTVDEKNFGIIDNGMITRQRAFYDMDSSSKQVLIDQTAENLDREHFTALDATNTNIMYLANGVATRTSTLSTAKTALTATDVLDPEFITKIKTWAKTNRVNGIPLQPVMVGGKPYFVLLVHPDQLADLEIDSTFAQARREADLRGKENPIFTGAYAVWNGVIIHDHENITIGTNAGAGANVAYAQSYLLGERALCLGWAKMPTVVAEEVSFGQKHAFASLSMFGIKKPQFTVPGTSTTTDFGSIVVMTARTNVSGL